MIKLGQRSGSKSRIRVVVTVAVILFFTWILGIEIVPNPSWGTSIAAVLGFAGVVFAFLQWFWPMHPVAHQDFSSQGIEKEILIIYTNRNLRGKSIKLYKGFLPYIDRANATPNYHAANVVMRSENGHTQFYAKFYVTPGQYTAYVCYGIIHKRCEPITVTAKIVTEVDWR